MRTDSWLDAVQIKIGYALPLGGPSSIRFYPQEIVCLLGPNGSGKSTFLKTILGLLPPLQGQVLLQGRSVQTVPRRQLAKTMAYVPQISSIHFGLSVLDVVLMGRYAYLSALSAPSHNDHQIAMESLDKLGLASLHSRIYTELSGGEQQLVLIARALAQQAEAIIMDEPTASLDFANQIKILNVIQELGGQGISIIFCTHQPQHAWQVASRIGLIKQGSLINQGTSYDMMQAPVLADLYGLTEQQVRTHLPGVF